MKKNGSIFIAFLLYFITANYCVSQQIHGIVIDAESKEVLPFAHVTYGNVGVLSNLGGEFQINLDSESSKKLKVSYVGFDTYESIHNSSDGYLRIILTPNIVQLSEVTVSTGNDFIRNVIDRIPANYDYHNLLMNAYYKERLDSNGSMTYLGEGILDIYRPSNVSSNKIQVSPIKARKFVSSEAYTKVRIKGHASDMVQSIIWRNDTFLSRKEIDNYEFYFGDHTSYQGRNIQIVEFEPKKEKGKYHGYIYIDSETFAIVKVEYYPEIRSNFWDVVKWEEEFSEKNGIWNLSRCMFSGFWSEGVTEYNFVAHLMIYDTQATENSNPINMNSKLNNSDCFYDAIDNFSEDFWGLDPHIKLDAKENSMVLSEGSGKSK